MKFLKLKDKIQEELNRKIVSLQTEVRQDLNSGKILNALI